MVYYLGKNFVTKRTILSMLMLNKPTLTDISRRLGKSPSTVKQHLLELQTMGMVRYVDEMHLSKFKYYECVPSFSASAAYRAITQRVVNQDMEVGKVTLQAEGRYLGIKAKSV
jgi:DNA-binding IclR family transcriptional regulator